jgi:hypothetical protein
VRSFVCRRDAPAEDIDPVVDRCSCVPCPRRWEVSFPSRAARGGEDLVVCMSERGIGRQREDVEGVGVFGGEHGVQGVAAEDVRAV